MSNNTKAMSFEWGVKHTSQEPKITCQIKTVFNLNEGREHFSANFGKLDYHREKWACWK